MGDFSGHTAFFGALKKISANKTSYYFSYFYKTAL